VGGSRVEEGGGWREYRREDKGREEMRVRYIYIYIYIYIYRVCY